ncbi:NADH-quinone oxidoreductase subunit C [Candidatus Poribacteria bacterium]|nr:NADH-quinone oxidoreductase subunit C [Candidatus Poribacteria bacterium]
MIANENEIINSNDTYKILKENFIDEILDVKLALGELTVTVKKDKISAICLFLRDNKELDFKFLKDLCGADSAPEKPRFKVVYHLYSITKNNSLRIRVPLDIDDLTIVSVENIWKTANWMEREAYDMFGIKFTDHPFMHRILMSDDWEGYPLRKDYPLKGY